MRKSAESPIILQAGYTNMYRYIGSMPVLSALQQTLLTEAGLVRAEQIEDPGDKNPSSVAFFFTESYGSAVAADAFVQERKRQMAGVLRSAGYPVEERADLVDMRGGSSSPFTPATEIQWGTAHAGADAA